MRKEAVAEMKTHDNPSSWAGRLRRTAIVFLAAGTMFGVSCSPTTVRAIIDGIDAVTRSLDTNISSQDLTFGEWLIDELESL